MVAGVKRIKVLDVPVDSLTMAETLSLINNSIVHRKPLHHVVINAAKIVNAHKDRALMQSIVNCDIINADGQAVVWASYFLNQQPLPERVTGIDLMHNLVTLAYNKGYHIYFLGAKEKVLSKVISYYTSKYGTEIIAGFRNGYFDKQEEITVARNIAKSGADILFVAMGSPHKEVFLETYKKILNVPFIMGVGGSFDVVSGFVKRAPKWVQNAGFEWLFRIIQEPKRMWKRYLITNSKFIYLFLKELLLPSHP